MMDIQKKFLKLPPAPQAATGIGKDYRFRKVAHVIPADETGWATDDLAPFVDLSDKSADIAASHEGLKGPTRHALYEAWHTLNPDSFLILDHRDADGSWKPAAVSIVLPLTQQGYNALSHGENDAVGMKPSDIARTAEGESASHLLIDTWIIDENLRHGATQGYGEALLTKHLSQLWDPKKQPEISLSVEPDAESVRQLIEKAGFEKSTADGSNFYAKEIATRDANRSPVVHQLLKNVAECKSWPCVGETSPGKGMEI